jgi:NAD+ diphosphatase
VTLTADIVFAGARLDRAAARRVPGAFAEGLDDPAARGLVVTGEAVWIRRDQDGVNVFFQHPTALAGEKVMLGTDAIGPIFAVDGDDAVPPPDAEVAELRGIAAELSGDAAGLAAYGCALLNWHRRNRFCGRCGGTTATENAGHTRRCEACGTEHFPRTDPAVIVRVSHEDRLLLVHEARWPTGLYSLPAGFVEPGETLEEAVQREVFEETGVEVTAPRYLASQPWPFPRSLMLGFTAAAAGADLEPDGHEVEDARWFTRAELLAEADPTVSLPGEFSIARWLINGWLA